MTPTGTRKNDRGLIFVFVASYVAFVAIGLAAGIARGRALFEPTALGILAIAPVSLAVAAVVAFLDDRRPSKRDERIQMLAVAVMAAVFLALLTIGPLGSANGWLPPMDGCQGGCGEVAVPPHAVSPG